MTRQKHARDARDRAIEASEAMLDSAAAVGPAVLALFEDPAYIESIDAAELLMCLGRIQEIAALVENKPRAAAKHRRELLRCIRRALASRAMIAATTRVHERLLGAGELLALEKLQAAEQLSARQLLTEASILFESDIVQSVVQELVARLERALDECDEPDDDPPQPAATQSRSAPRRRSRRKA